MRRHKYHAIATTVDGIRFASQAEARRYQALRLLEKAGKITRLKLQPKFALSVSNTLIGHYIADFQYHDGDGQLVIEDVKGVKTPLYKWKKKHVEAQYWVTITEVTG